MYKSKRKQEEKLKNIFITLLFITLSLSNTYYFMKNEVNETKIEELQKVKTLNEYECLPSSNQDEMVCYKKSIRMIHPDLYK